MEPKQKIPSAYLVLPLFLFPIWYIPYSWLNKNYIVNWFGCGCPVTDEFGNAVSASFNANDFTALFWGVIALCTTILSVVFSKKLLNGRLRILYIVGVLAVSLLLAYWFTQTMLWR
ncbi:MAG: hypothetical protein J6Q30_07935 [Oscillospiraceae bacterium]|nr:hypothetical protein [Oscillospiraceae bacterium]